MTSRLRPLRPLHKASLAICLISRVGFAQPVAPAEPPTPVDEPTGTPQAAPPAAEPGSEIVSAPESVAQPPAPQPAPPPASAAPAVRTRAEPRAQSIETDGELLQDAGPSAYEDLSLVNLMNLQVVTTSRRAQHLEHAPATVYVITGRDIKDRGYVNLIDVLRDVPGIDPSLIFFSEMGASVAVRGATGNNKIVVLVNGMRVNPPGGEEAPFRSDFSVRGAKQIEISYGPGSTLYGQDAIFAVVNVITEKPKLGYHFSVSGAYGYRDYKDGFASVSGVFGSRQNPVFVQLYAQIIDSSLWDLSKSHPDWWKTLYANAKTLGADPPKRWDRGFNSFLRMESGNTSFQAWYRDSSRSSSEGGSAGGLYFVEEAVWQDRSLVLEGQHRFDLTKSAKLFTTLTYNRYEVDPDSRYVFRANPDSLFLNDYKYARGASFQLDERALIDVTKELSLAVGATVAEYDSIPKATIPGGADLKGDITAQGGAFEYYTEIGNPASLQRIQRVNHLTYQSYAAYAEAQWQALDALRLVGGIRLDKNSRFDELPLSPRLAAIYSLTENITAKYIFNQAFVAPAPYYGYNAFANGTELNTTNPDLEPERATANELNITYTDRQLHAGLSAFYLQQRDLLSSNNQRTLDEEVYLDVDGTATRRLTQTGNDGRTTSFGADLYAQAHFKPVSPWASVSFVDSTTKRAGRETGLDQLSPLNIRLGAAIRPLKKLVVTPSLMLRSSLEFVDGGKEALQGHPDGVTEWPYELSLHAGYTLLDGLEIFATGRNITNHRYATKGKTTAAPQEGAHGFAGVRFSH